MCVCVFALYIYVGKKYLNWGAMAYLGGEAPPPLNKWKMTMNNRFFNRQQIVFCIVDCVVYSVYRSNCHLKFVYVCILYIWCKGGRFTTFFELQTLFKWQYIDLLYWKHQKKNQADCFFWGFQNRIGPPHI